MDTIRSLGVIIADARAKSLELASRPGSLCDVNNSAVIDAGVIGRLSAKVFLLELEVARLKREGIYG